MDRGHQRVHSSGSFHSTRSADRAWRSPGHVSVPSEASSSRRCLQIEGGPHRAGRFDGNVSLAVLLRTGRAQIDDPDATHRRPWGGTPFEIQRRDWSPPVVSDYAAARRLRRYSCCGSCRSCERVGVREPPSRQRAHKLLGNRRTVSTAPTALVLSSICSRSSTDASVPVRPQGGRALAAQSSRRLPRIYRRQSIQTKPPTNPSNAASTIDPDTIIALDAPTPPEPLPAVREIRNGIAIGRTNRVRIHRLAVATAASTPTTAAVR